MWDVFKIKYVPGRISLKHDFHLFFLANASELEYENLFIFSAS